MVMRGQRRNVAALEKKICDYEAQIVELRAQVVTLAKAAGVPVPPSGGRG